MFVTTYKTTRYHDPNEFNLNFHRHKTLNIIQNYVCTNVKTEGKPDRKLNIVEEITLTITN
jgi:hypothetical protein